MRRLTRQVGRPSRIRRHHVLLAAIGLGLAIHEAGAAIDALSTSKEQVTRAYEARVLDTLVERSLRACPRDLSALADGVDLDVWGHPYKLLCDDRGTDIYVAIISAGPPDGQPISAVIVY